MDTQGSQFITEVQNITRRYLLFASTICHEFDDAQKQLKIPDMLAADMLTDPQQLQKSLEKVRVLREYFDRFRELNGYHQRNYNQEVAGCCSDLPAAKRKAITEQMGAVLQSQLYEQFCTLSMKDSWVNTIQQLLELCYSASPTTSEDGLCFADPEDQLKFDSYREKAEFLIKQEALFEQARTDRITTTLHQYSVDVA